MSEAGKKNGAGFHTWVATIAALVAIGGAVYGAYVWIVGSGVIASGAGETSPQQDPPAVMLPPDPVVEAPASAPTAPQAGGKSPSSTNPDQDIKVVATAPTHAPATPDVASCRKPRKAGADQVRAGRAAEVRIDICLETGSCGSREFELGQPAYFIFESQIDGQLVAWFESLESDQASGSIVPYDLSGGRTKGEQVTAGIPLRWPAAGQTSFVADSTGRGCLYAAVVPTARALSQEQLVGAKGGFGLAQPALSEDGKLSGWGFGQLFFDVTAAP